MNNTECSLGIALLAQVDPGYHWAMVLHNSSYNDEVRLYQIVNRDPNGGLTEWRTYHQTRHLAEMDELIGVVHISRICATVPAIHALVEGFGSQQGSYDDRGLGWNDVVWALQILERLANESLIYLPYDISEMDLFVLDHVESLRLLKSQGVPVPVVSYWE